MSSYMLGTNGKNDSRQMLGEQKKKKKENQLLSTSIKNSTSLQSNFSGEHQ